MMIEENEEPKKTWKRELAAFVLAVYLVLLIMGIWSPEAATAAENIKIQAFAFAALAFGMDAWSKQMR